MPKLTKVNTDSAYKKRYIKVDEFIYEANVAKAMYPKLKNKIDRIVASNPTKNVVTTLFRTFPSNEVMLQRIIDKKNYIYNHLNLKGITGEGADIVKAGVLFLYLSKNTRYDESMTEITGLNQIRTGYTEKRIAENIKQYTQLYHKKKTQKGIKLNKQLKHLALETMFLEQKKQTKQASVISRRVLKSIYSVLINKEGVCADFSYANQYLLNGLNIPCVTVVVQNNTAENLHVINAVGFELNNKKQIYFTDLVKGNYDFHSSKNELNMIGFAEPMTSTFLTGEKNIIEIHKELDLNKKLPECVLSNSVDEREIKQIMKQGMLHYELESYVYYVKQFVMSGYKAVHLDSLKENEVY
jgi:hypothetical protein